VVSPFVGLLASSLSAGTRVLVPAGEFTSNLFPYLVQQHARGLEVETVPLETLAERVVPGVGLVAVSAVQSSDGTVTDLTSLAKRAHDVGALLAVDATQAVGWLPVDASQVDLLVCGGYKWLCSPRGSSFCVVSPALCDTLVPQAAGWYAGEAVHASYYGPSMTLAGDARRFDTSPAWPVWVGTAPAVELLEQVGVEQVREHNVGLANRFRAGLGLEPSNSAIVSAQVADAGPKLEAAGVRAASRAGSLRVSFHLYSTVADVDLALDALVG
ncbi:MAG: aminotransferase class V-fold PLP-dependent enzyme, partial [Nocardioidaceae bacterium]